MSWSADPVRVWDAVTGEVLHELTGYTGGVRVACLHPAARSAESA